MASEASKTWKYSQVQCSSRAPAASSCPLTGDGAHHAALLRIRVIRAQVAAHVGDTEQIQEPDL